MSICSYCQKQIRPGKNRVTINGHDYHSSCFDRRQEHERRRRPGEMGITVVQAKLAAGMLPVAQDVAIRFVPDAAGVCVACDLILDATEIGVAFEGGGVPRLLHVDCYMVWTEACDS